MKKYIKWLFVFIWMFLIFLFSNESGVESTKTSQFFVEKVQFFFSGISFPILGLFVRKSAHFFLYFILGILVGNAMNNQKKWWLFSLFICLIYACTDEIHQLFMVGRSGQIQDVILDSIGSSVGISLYYWFHRKKIAQ